MKLAKTFGLAVIGATLATGVSALDSKYTDVNLHGSAHHHHSDGDWHGIKPHTHNGVTTHRGHSHTAPAANLAAPAPVAIAPAAAGNCGLGLWRNNLSLQRCRVSQSGAYQYTYDFR